MRSIGTRARRGAAALAFTSALALAASQRDAARATEALQSALPARLSDSAFWGMITSMSEPGGYFRSDNLVSNELTFQHVIPELQRTLGTGGVYLGVGPDQNFTYIAALQPRIAFIVDIRRGNLQQQLLYKALVELSRDRGEFLSLLFSRPRPADATVDAPVDSLFAAYDSIAPDTAQLARTMAAIHRRLVREHHFPLDSADLTGIAYVLQAFYEGGPQLTYSFGGGMRGYGMRGMPTYGELMVQTDADGMSHGYLASEMHFRRLREMELANLIVPLVGDFGGDKALKAVGSYLKTYGANVSAIYTSNVEQYLFAGDDAWRRYYTNVGTLPTDARTVFVRAVFNYGGYRDTGVPRGPRSVTMLSPVRELLAGVQAGTIQSYWDVIQASRSPVEGESR